MTGEAASTIGLSIANEVRSLRGQRAESSPALTRMVAALCDAPAETAVDALALAAFSRKLLTEVVREQMPIDPGDEGYGRLTNEIYALSFLLPVIAFLESATGYCAESFTGEGAAIH